MKTKFIACCAVSALLCSTALCASLAAGVSSGVSFDSQVQAIVARMKTKLQNGLRTEADFSTELSQLDDLIASRQSEKPESVALALYYQGLFYYNINEDDKGLKVYELIAQSFPTTNTGMLISKSLPQLEPQKRPSPAIGMNSARSAAQMAAQAAQAAQNNLAVGKLFSEFAVSSGAVKDITGKPLSVAQYKGKIVLIDFWATWCGPCMGEMPNVVAAYQKYHGKGFDIIGVSLDQPSGVAKLQAFLVQNKMPWRQFCDGKYWQNELAVEYNIHSIPASYLLDGTGKIIAVNPRGTALAPAIEAALAGKI